MRVVAWNIRAGGPGRTAGIVGRLAALGADVAVVGAVPPNGVGAKLRGYLSDVGLEHQVVVEPPARGTGLLVAAREPIRRGDVDGAPVPASWLHVEGLPFELGAVYAPGPDGDPASAGARARTLDWLADAVGSWRDRPALLCGDFHEGPFEGRLEDGWRDLFLEAHGDAADWSWWSPGSGPSRPDQAIGSPALSVPEAVAYGDAEGLADHRPLLVDVAC